MHSLVNNTGIEVIDDFDSWLRDRQMRYAADKSFIMVINTTERVANSFYGDLGISIVSSMKVLGVIIDNSLTFQQHISEIRGKVVKNIGAVKMLRKSGLKYDRAIQVVKCVRNKLTFGLWWYCFISESNKTKMNALFNNLLRSALGANKLFPVDQMYLIAGCTSLLIFVKYLMCSKITSRDTRHSTSRYLPTFRDLRLIKQEISEISADQPRSRQLRATTERQSSDIRKNLFENKIFNKHGKIWKHVFDIAVEHELIDIEIGTRFHPKQIWRNFFAIKPKIPDDKVFNNNFDLYDYMKNVSYNIISSKNIVFKNSM